MKSLDFARELDRLAQAREPFAVATVIGIEGSSLGKPGFKAIISKHGRIAYGTLGGVCPESAISSFALEAIRTGKSKTVKVYLEDAKKSVAATLAIADQDEVHVETNCGGAMQIYVEPYLPADRLIVVANGERDELESALVNLGKFLDFEVVIIDPLAVLEEQPDVMITDKDYDLTKYRFSETDSVIILTHSAKDVPILTHISTQKVRYVGVMSSFERAKGEAAFLVKRGVPREFVGSIKSPVGADIGAKTMREIAVSIISEIIASKYGKSLPRRSILTEASTGETRKLHSMEA